MILKDHLGLDFIITDKKNDLINFTGPKICYSPEYYDSGSFNIKSENLLFETGVRPQNVSIGNWDNIVTLYNNESSQDFSFDIFSASFFLVTRYEEYIPHIKDKYDRFESESSIAYSHGFLDLPIVNYWIQKFSNVLKEKFSFLNFKFPKYKFISSIDIDNAFAFKHKGIMRSLGGYVRGLINLNWKNISERTKVILNKVPDPFDSYAFQLELQKKYDFPVIYFFLLGDYGVNDKNLPANNKQLRYLIKHLSDYFEIGIHPSFGSKNNSIQVKKEINRLYRITHKDVFSSRQHFSILSFPSTYQMLLDNEIKQDFSMGYHDRAGFRAGISTSYFWYDLENELETALKIYPLVFSETTFRFGMRLNPEESLQKAIQLIDRIKVTNGTFVSCFHNESMTDYGEWKGWKNFYEQIIQESIK